MRGPSSGLRLRTLRHTTVGSTASRRFAILLALSGLLAGCTSGGSTTASPTSTVAPTDTLTGTLVGYGSATTLTAAKLVTAAFTKLHPNVTVTLNITDTETSIVMIRNADPETDFGFIGRELLPTDGAVLTTLIGATGSAFAVNAANKVRALSKAQLAAILTGQITDWSAVGGSGAIRVVTRETTSQTRSSLESYVFGATKPTYAPLAVSTSGATTASTEMLDTLKSFSGAIGMVTLDSATLANKTIGLVGMDGIPPTTDAVASGTWPVRRASYLTTNADPTKVSPLAKALVDFIKSPDGQKLIGG
jgi:phosphate transport system substrate-binding protein